MCVAIPFRISEVEEAGPTRVGLADVDGRVRRIDLSFVPEADVGSWVVAHSGFAVRLMSEEEAVRTRDLVREAMEPNLGEPVRPD